MCERLVGEDGGEVHFADEGEVDGGARATAIEKGFDFVAGTGTRRGERDLHFQLMLRRRLDGGLPQS